MLSILRHFALCIVLASFGFAQDAEGCRDHPLLSRMPGFRIQRCTQEEFGAHSFGKAGKEISIEGRYTEILYTLEEGVKEPSRLQIQRNFEQAIQRMGGKTLAKDDDGNLYLKVVGNHQEIWIHINAYISSQYTLYIVEKAVMRQDVLGNVASLDSTLKNEGRIAVYSLHFDTGKTELKPNSEPTLVEIAKLLKAQPTLKLYVVGHTDNVASLELNLQLSRARAETVVQALVTRYNIAASRLKAHGLGPLAPNASNNSEAGRNKNRRVELVQQ